MRIVILDHLDTVLSVMDNDLPEALHFYDDTLHLYLTGAAATFEFTATTEHEDSEDLKVGNRLAFVDDYDRQYYMNIVNTEQDEDEITVTAYSGMLTLMNDISSKFSGTSWTFRQYVKYFDFGGLITIGLFELDEKATRSIEWTSTSTLLNRLFSIATNFGAEIEFVPKLNKDYSLKSITMNVYKEHDDDHQGIGRDRRDYIIRYGKEITGITRELDITGLYTAIVPLGKDDLTLVNWKNSETTTDSDGNKYYYEKTDGQIYALNAKDNYPSYINGNSRYIWASYYYDTDDKATLYGNALSQLKKYSKPQATYTVDGYVDGSIGDTFTIVDQEFEPELYLSARVIEQEISFTDPTQNKTTFDNFYELESQLSDSILAQMNKLIDKNLPYSVRIVADQTVFKGTRINANLTAWIYRGSEQITYAALKQRGYDVVWSDGTTSVTGESYAATSEDNTMNVTCTIKEKEASS